MSELLTILTSSTRGPWTNSDYVSGADSVNVKIIDRATLPFWPMMSVRLPRWAINDQFIQGAAEIMKVWMCLCVVFLH